MISLLLCLLQENPVPAALSREIVGPRTSIEEIQAYLEPRIPPMPAFENAAEWRAHADRMRRDVLDRVVFRGEAAAWRDYAFRVEEKDEIAGPGYRIRKLRYEAVPGLWIPALLYLPEKLEGRVPAHLAVNGHDGAGKAAAYKQARCVNLVKRGMIVLNVEWLGMGQLRGPDNGHALMNQLDLCGTSGLAPFYLSMKNGLDLLLAHPNADPARTAVHGLSGGGWQTIFFSALDTRVVLANPVAGYSSFRTRVRHLKDLGDSEQTPADLATVADYAQLTAMRAPRPTLLTFNGKDNCCFESTYALQPLLDAARPAFRAFDRDDALRSHVNHAPGDHNFGQDNREALYRMVGDHFYPGRPFDAAELPFEIRTPEELAVELPADNATFLSLARNLARALPRSPEISDSPRWRVSKRLRLREILRAPSFEVRATAEAPEEIGGLRITRRRFSMSGDFTVPAVEIAPAAPAGTTLIFAEAGRKALAEDVTRLVKEGRRVVAIDPFYYGESKFASHDYLFALTLATVGGRALGVQAEQIGAAARWAEREFGAPAALEAVGPRASLVALCAAALEEKAIDGLTLRGSYGSLKEPLEAKMGVNQAPELFTFGLLEAFDIPQLAALSAPRSVRFERRK
jgi:hypothetical protein